MTDGAPTQLGTLQLEALVAQGGMGQIWRATDLRDGTPVAVKRIHGGRTQKGLLRERLLLEMRAFQRVQHANIVRCLDAGFDDDDQPYLALEWLDGEDLAHRSRRVPLELDAIVELARQSLLGLRACHAEGIVHRDIKPANLFLVADASSDESHRFHVKVLDFGLARCLDDGAPQLTATGVVAGTLHYLAPEQARGRRDIDGRVDLYALGVVLYELCTGKLPFAGEGAAAVLLRIITERPPRPRAIRPSIPAWLEGLVLRAMAKEPDERFADADEMLEALEQGVSSPAGMAAAEGDSVDKSDLELAETTLLRAGSSLERRLVWLLCVTATQGTSSRNDVGQAGGIAEFITAAGGIAIELFGGQIVGLFGLERSLGDEAQRAVRSGLAIRQASGERESLLVAAVYLEVGERLHFDRHGLDRAVAGARRLPAGELVVDRVTRDLLGTSLELARVGDHDVVRTLCTREPRQLFGAETPFTGRETECATITAAFERIEDYREPELLLIEGATGIGKTRLCKEASTAFSDRCELVLDGRGDPLQAGVAYGLVRQLLATACRIHAGQSTEDKTAALDSFIDSCSAAGALGEKSRAFLLEVLGLSGSETSPAATLLVARQARELMREQVTSAFAALLDKACQSGVALLFVDDLHWADHESVQLLCELTERLPRTPIFLLFAARPNLPESIRAVLDAAQPTPIKLPPLSRRALRRLLRAARVEATPELEKLVADWTNGNPYFAEELLTWLAARDALVQRDGRWHLEVLPTVGQLPTSIEAAVQARLDQLTVPQKDLLRSAAIFGDVFWTGACVSLGFTAAQADLHVLETQQLIVRQTRSRFADDEQWAFRHTFVHQVAAHMNPSEQQRMLHDLAAHWLEDAGESDPLLLAHHYERAGQDERAAHQRAAAAERALHGGDLDQAADHYLASLSCRTEITDAEQTRRAIGLAGVYILLGQYDQARMALDHAKPTDDAQVGQLTLLRGRILFGRGDYALAEVTLEQALELLAGRDESQARPRGKRDRGARRRLLGALLDASFLARHTLFAVVWAQGRYEDAARVALALRAQANASERSDQLCSAKLAQAYGHTVRGDLSLAVQLSNEAGVHAREVGHLYREVDCLVLLGSLQELVGLYDEARTILARAGQLAERLKTTYHLATVDAGSARISWLRSDEESAIAQYRRAFAAAESISSHRIMIGALAGEARALARTGAWQDLAGARAAAERALQLASSQAPPSQAEAQLALCEVYLAAGDDNRALEHAVAAVELLELLGGQERYEVEILLAAHAALTRSGDEATAQGLLEQAAARLQRRAKKISDTELRRSFKERVPHNARLAAMVRRG